jgi:hypothetical protein
MHLLAVCTYAPARAGHPGPCPITPTPPVAIVPAVGGTSRTSHRLRLLPRAGDRIALNTVIIFISSVRRGLEDERDYLPGLLKASGHQSRRFEDFSAQPVPSRAACLAGVEAAEVYLLLLGPHYGDPLPDTGQAPTEEEFTVAKNRGLPILVFRKVGDTTDDRQQDFIKRVGDYQQGRFWKEFRDNGDLAIAVLDSLREVAQRETPLRWEPVDTMPAVRWRSDRPALAGSAIGDVPVLEGYVASVAAGPVLTVSALEPLTSQLVRAGRGVGLFPESASVTLGSDVNSAWAVNPGEMPHGGWNQVHRAGPAGVAVDRDGSVLVFRPLVRDTLGSLVDQVSLTRELELMLRLGYEVLPAGVSEFAPAAGLGPITGVTEGNPAEIGHRHGGSGLRMSTDVPVRTTADVKVAATALPAGIPEIARELAARILADLRTRR